jgi:hypothetical protein
VRTLVISDLHLGSIAARDVLRRPAALAALEAQVERADRLVLLGDTIELLDARPQAARAAAAQVLPRLGAALGRGGEAVIVPGNHDHALVRPWVRERLAAGASLPPAGRVARRSSPLLGELARLLAPARVQVRYPGLWLGPRIYATHGHYIDRHLLAALSEQVRPGAARRGVAAGDGEDAGSGFGARRASVSDYERARGIDVAALQDALAGALPAPLAAGAVAAVGATRRALLTGLPRVGPATRMRGASRIWATLLEHGHARRGAIPAMALVAQRLGIDADAIVFGHIHRRGPLPGDRPSIWRPLGGSGPRLLNTGCWVWDPALRGRPGGPRPYRPGGAVLLTAGRAPRALDLLADVPDDELE